MRLQSPDFLLLPNAPVKHFEFGPARGVCLLILINAHLILRLDVRAFGEGRLHDLSCLAVGVRGRAFVGTVPA